MKPLSVLLADDERPARTRLEDLLATRPDVALVRACKGGAEAVEAIRATRPDIVFLDVQMPEVDGLEVVRRVGLEAMPVTIFVTAYDRYALEAFDARAIDYLLKPYSDERFGLALDRAVRYVQGDGAHALVEKLGALLGGREAPPPAPLPEETPDRIDRFVVKGSSRIYFVEAARVAWIEGAGNYVVLHADGQRHLYRSLVGRLAVKLDPRLFVRVHKSAIVNLGYVRELLPDSHGEFTVVLTDGTAVKLSRTYRADVEARLGQTL